MSYFRNLFFKTVDRFYENAVSDGVNVPKMDIKVHSLSNDPNAAWKVLSKTQKVTKIDISPSSTNVPDDMVRVVCMSDTHSLTPQLNFDIPKGDIFIHAGDFTTCGSKNEVVNFNKWLGTLPHKYKIVIAGNHDVSFDPTYLNHCSRVARGLRQTVKTPDILKILTNCIYLEDSQISLYGMKIYGTPWQPEFCDWAFNLPRGQECLNKWNLIPDDTDILISHGPPLGFGDLCDHGGRAGCVELLTTVQQRVLPKYHIFGHIHEGYGVFSDGKITYINASTCNLSYSPVNPPIVFDVPLPPGQTKSDSS